MPRPLQWLSIVIFLLVVLVQSRRLLPFERTARAVTENPTSDGAEQASSLGAVPVKRASSAIAITAAGHTLLAVNPDANSLAVIDLGEPPVVTEIAVGAQPRTVAVSDDGARAYTANYDGSSISAIDLVARREITRIAVGARPYGVVLSPDGHSLYVTEQGHDRLTIIDTITPTPEVSVSMPDRPSGLAISGDGKDLYVTHLLRNTITRIGLPVRRDYLPLVVHSHGTAGTSFSESPSLASYDNALLSAIPLWPDSNLLQSIVIAPDGQHAYVPHTRSNSGNPALTLDTTVFPLVSIVDLAIERHLTGQQFNLATLDPPAVGLPFDAAFSPDGATLWVVNAASNDVTVLDLEARQRIAHVEVGHNPRGIVMDPAGRAAYVNNTLEGTISVIGTSTFTVTTVIPVTSLPLHPVLLAGKRLFHSSDDPRLGRDQWLSCNTCHFDGQIDGQTWMLGFAGPRNTSSLQGMSDTLPLRWSGEWDEAADSEFAIRMDSFGTGLIAGAMHCSLNPPDCTNHPPHAGLSADLDALAAYINSLTVSLSPHQPIAQPLSQAALRGRDHFNDPALGCAACHPPPLYTDNLLHDVGTMTEDERVGPDFNTPSLQGIYDTAPYFHDGSALTLYEALTRPTVGGEHDVRDILIEREIQDLIAYLLALPY